MEIRKLQGKNGYLSLQVPFGWVKVMGLDKGDYVTITALWND